MMLRIYTVHDELYIYDACVIVEQNVISLALGVVPFRFSKNLLTMVVCIIMDTLLCVCV